MKNLIISAVASLALFTASCASSDPSDSDGSGEATAQDDQALLQHFYGYCDVGANGLLTGRCRGCSSMCSTSPDSECPVGVKALRQVTYPGSYCASVSYDSQRRCSTYLSCY